MSVSYPTRSHNKTSWMYHFPPQNHYSAKSHHVPAVSTCTRDRNCWLRAEVEKVDWSFCCRVISSWLERTMGAILLPPLRGATPFVCFSSWPATTVVGSKPFLRYIAELSILHTISSYTSDHDSYRKMAASPSTSHTARYPMRRSQHPGYVPRCAAFQDSCTLENRRMNRFFIPDVYLFLKDRSRWCECARPCPRVCFRVWDLYRLCFLDGGLQFLIKSRKNKT